VDRLLANKDVAGAPRHGGRSRIVEQHKAIHRL
jgi:hypothetical protein